MPVSGRMSHTRPRLLFLLGAHKTASSHLQHSLLAARARLRTKGIGVIGPQDMRRDIAALSSALRDGMTPPVATAGAAEFLNHFGGAVQTHVLMDENILGSTVGRMLLRNSQLYPWGARRLSRVLSLFPDHQIEIALSLRNPAQFLPSCWGESLHHGAFQPFDKYIEDMAPGAAFWSNLIARLRKAAPKACLTVWQYEDYPHLGTQLYTDLLGPFVADCITPDPRIRRPGLSLQAAQWLTAHPQPDKAALKEARKRFPKTGAQDAYDPWSSQDKDKINAAYRLDISHLRSQADIRFLLPANA